MTPQITSVPKVSRTLDFPEKLPLDLGVYEVIDSTELSRRLGVPTSWVRDGVRGRREQQIPHVKFGRYTRFLWNSPELLSWIERQKRGGGR